MEKYGNCDQICLPSYSIGRQHTHTCECGIGYEKSSIDPNSCTAMNSFILVSMTTQIRGFSMVDGARPEYEGDAVSPIGPAGNISRPNSFLSKIVFADPRERMLMY